MGQRVPHGSQPQPRLVARHCEARVDRHLVVIRARGAQRLLPPGRVAHVRLNRLFGNNAASYHAGNVLLHAGAIVLLLRFIARRKIAAPSHALPVVALFATLPLVAEPVSWVAGRYDLLAAFFTLVTLTANEGRLRAWLTALAYALAVLSKEPGVVVAGLVLLDDVLLLRRPLLGELPKYGALAVALVACLGLRHLADVPQPTTLLEQGGVPTLLRAYAFAWETFARLAVLPRDLRSSTPTFHRRQPRPFSW